jgi:hypothetical protein
LEVAFRIEAVLNVERQLRQQIAQKRVLMRRKLRAFAAAVNIAARSFGMIGALATHIQNALFS